jgi:nucleoside-diphosphate-sugar epimerase
MAHTRILIIGAGGQVGTELTEALRARYGGQSVIASDLNPNPELGITGPYEVLNVLDKSRLEEIINQYKIDTIYHLAALLSATGEKNPALAWDLNCNGLLNVLNVMRDMKLSRLFWPSTIAVFGPHTPRHNTPQYCVMDPNTMYGLTKLAGERLCEYYFNKFGVDVRSLRYPGLIGWKAAPGGGTTDYAVHIFYDAIKSGKYTCFLSGETSLPMMHMEDAIKATIDLMHAEGEKLSIRSSYNLAGMSFTPEELTAEIKKLLPEFAISYAPDYRQAIADSWPASIDDSVASTDWGWNPSYDLAGLTRNMMDNIRVKIEGGAAVK